MSCFTFFVVHNRRNFSINNNGFHKVFPSLSKQQRVNECHIICAQEITEEVLRTLYNFLFRITHTNYKHGNDPGNNQTGCAKKCIITVHCR
jgi:hypothetical protein